ncbi:hypothetical protein [[Phormidium] sp. ETS-05]|uniref:hypothetical protein n=1 Tax=[Phormidium] sp. ETS-05 TaxID=222819 RepID=UPI0018EF257C|nr:hypothetical protein [[Phormidium] sp. ETS-05]
MSLGRVASGPPDDACSEQVDRSPMFPEPFASYINCYQLNHNLAILNNSSYLGE